MDVGTHLNLKERDGIIQHLDLNCHHFTRSHSGWRGSSSTHRASSANVIPSGGTSRNCSAVFITATLSTMILTV
uniref:Uncharacterized protein n=1 Tax=Lepeophtheirus salmonis TaxID=72036 RepID=A0A0K2USH3_LEPSM